MLWFVGVFPPGVGLLMGEGGWLQWCQFKVKLLVSSHQIVCIILMASYLSFSRCMSRIFAIITTAERNLCVSKLNILFLSVYSRAREYFSLVLQVLGKQCSLKLLQQRQVLTSSIYPCQVSPQRYYLLYYYVWEVIFVSFFSGHCNACFPF